MKASQFFHDHEGRLVLMQWPNAWLIVWAATTLLRFFSWPHEILTGLRIVGLVALVIWALLEIFRGVNYFRRSLGVIVLILTIASIAGLHL